MSEPRPTYAVEKMSDLERAFLTAWHRFAPPYLPEPEPQYHFARPEVGDEPHPPARPGLRKRLAAAGLHDWAFDFCWASKRLAVEVDGGQWVPHGGRHNTDRDRDKLNHAAALGWRVLRFSGSMLRDDPDACVALVVGTWDRR